MRYESHEHIFMNGRSYQEAMALHLLHPDEADVRQKLAAYRERSITLIRDGGDPFGVSMLAKRLAPDYGISFLTPVFAIHKKGHYGSIVGRGFDSSRDYEALVREVRDLGGDFIKIMTTGIMTFRSHDGLTEDPIDGELVAEMVDIAHSYGMKVMSHTNGAAAVIEACRAGVDSIEHGNFQNEESIQAMEEAGTVWVPTSVTIHNLIGDGRFEDRVLRQIWEELVPNLELAWRRGIPLAVGSDAGAYRVLHGEGACQEYEILSSLFGGEPDFEQRIEEAGECIRAFARHEE